MSQCPSLSSDMPKKQVGWVQGVDDERLGRIRGKGRRGAEHSQGLKHAWTAHLDSNHPLLSFELPEG